MQFSASPASHETSVATAKMKKLQLRKLPRQRKLSIETLMKDFKSTVLEKHQIEYRVISIIRLIFELFGLLDCRESSTRIDFNGFSFDFSSSSKEVTIESWVEYSSSLL